MIDICLQRVVSAEVFRFEKLKDANTKPEGSFKKAEPGNEIVK
jgi:hypothetical protein